MTTKVVDLIKSLNRSFELCSTYESEIRKYRNQNNDLKKYVAMYHHNNIGINSIRDTEQGEDTNMNIDIYKISSYDTNPGLVEIKKLGNTIRVSFGDLKSLEEDVINNDMDDVMFAISYSPPMSENILSIENEIRFIEDFIHTALL